MSGEAVPDSITPVSSAPIPVLPYASGPDSGAGDAGAVPEHHPYVPAEANIPEFTWSAVLLGAILGIIFGASSLYLVLKVGLTVSASIPVAVFSITLFRVFSKVFKIRRATILENNIVQTTGSAGESIAFGVGVTMPALMLLGFDMDAVRVMTVGVLGGLLGILMMIPLRRAFIVKQHGKLKYPEGTACADVLIVGEQGGSSAKTVFTGFGLAFVYKILMDRFKLWKGTLDHQLVQQERTRVAGRGAGRRFVAGVAWRRLHHRPADRIGDDGGGRAGIPGDRAHDRHFQRQPVGPHRAVDAPRARPGGAGNSARSAVNTFCISAPAPWPLVASSACFRRFR